MSRPQPRWYKGYLLVPFYEDDGTTLCCWDVHPNAGSYTDSLDSWPEEENLPTLAAAKAAVNEIAQIDRLLGRLTKGKK